MDNKFNKLFPILAAIAVFGTLSFFLIKILPGIGAVEIDMQSDHPDKLRVFYSYYNTFREENASPTFSINEQRAKIKVSLTGNFTNFLRIDTGGQLGTVKIYQLKVSSYFHAPLLLGPNEIGQLFVAGPDATMQVFPEYVQVTAKGNDPYLVGKTRIFDAMYWQVALIALTFALFVGILMLRKVTPMVGHEGSGRQPAGNAQSERFDALDGLRGLAAMMVIADHTCGWFSGVGATGVWIFFALSGFLLARPFIGNPQAVLSFALMSGYFRRRFMRILPMYYVYIFVVFVLSKRYSLAFLHGLFLEGDGHLWALPQEILFYLLWPIVVLLLVLPLRRYPRLTMVLLLLVMAAWNRYVGIETIWLLGMAHNTMPLFFGVFLAGVFFSFLYSYCLAAATAPCPLPLYRVAGSTASILGFVVIIFFVLFSTGNIIGQKIVYSQTYFSYYGFLAGLLIFFILCAKGLLLDRVLSTTPLRELGKVGLSLYLVHPSIKILVEGFANTYFGYQMKNFPLFLATLVCSYILARYTFSHIEQPGFFEKPARCSAPL